MKSNNNHHDHHHNKQRNEQENENDETILTEDGVASILKIVKEEVDRRIVEMDRNAALEQRRHLRGRIHGDTPRERYFLLLLLFFSLYFNIFLFTLILLIKIIRYYNNPFRTKDLQNGGSLQQMCDSYLDGLCWVLNYYFQGPPSWGWYYPFHYAPCASDILSNVSNRLGFQSSMTYHFDHSSPLKPIEQLLCVLPAESAPALPLACRGLMTSKTNSPLTDIYHPKDILIDRGNEMSWLWIILLPFIDVNRIIKAAKECEPHFSEEETKRNSYGSAYLYVNSSQCVDLSSHTSSSSSVITSPHNGEESIKSEKDDLKNCLSEGSLHEPVYPLFGYVSSQPIETSNDEIDENLDDVVVVFKYFLPSESIHRSSLIEGILPMSSPLDLRFNRKKDRRNRGGRGRYRGRRRGGRGGGGRGDNGAGTGGGNKNQDNDDDADENNDDEQEGGDEGEQEGGEDEVENVQEERFDRGTHHEEHHHNDFHRDHHHGEHHGEFHREHHSEHHGGHHGGNR